MEEHNLLAVMLELDARHDELLSRLEDLDRRVESTLRDWLKLDKQGENGLESGLESRPEPLVLPPAKAA